MTKMILVLAQNFWNYFIFEEFLFHQNMTKLNIFVVVILQLGFIKKFHNIFENLVCLLCLSTFFLQGGLVLSIFSLGVAAWGYHKTFLQ